MAGYFEAKRAIKKIYFDANLARKRKDRRAINYAIYRLNELEQVIKNEYKLNDFGKYVLKKDIAQLHLILGSINWSDDEKKSERNTESGSSNPTGIENK